LGSKSHVSNQQGGDVGTKLLCDLQSGYGNRGWSSPKRPNCKKGISAKTENGIDAGGERNLTGDLNGNQRSLITKKILLDQ